MALAALLMAGCMPESHGIAPPYPYQGEEYPAAEIEAIAAAACRAEGMTGAPTHAFTTDGCSAWPDGDYLECCIEHDMQYWCGGTASRRKASDQQLRACVVERSSRLNGFAMYWGTRAGGGRLLPFSWRWGYGHPWPYRLPTASQPAR